MSAPYYADEHLTLHHGDVIEVAAALPEASVDCIVTSPPYYGGLRDYGVDGQLGAEESPAQYVENLVAVFAELRRVLSPDGTCWLNLGDNYTGSWGNQGRKPGRGTQRPITKPMAQRVHDGRYPSKGSRTGARRPGEPPAKNLMGMPWRVALALQDEGWYIRNDIIWAKPNPMPHPVRDRLVNAHEHLFLLTKKPRYHFDLDPIRAPAAAGGSRGRNPGDVWPITTSPFKGAHFATFPPEIPRRAIAAGCKPGGTVLDPFHGSGTTGMVARELGRPYIGIDISAAYLDLSLTTRLTPQETP